MNLAKITSLALLTYLTYQIAKEFENVYIFIAAIDILALLILRPWASASTNNAPHNDIGKMS